MLWKGSSAVAASDSVAGTAELAFQIEAGQGCVIEIGLMCLALFGSLVCASMDFSGLSQDLPIAHSLFHTGRQASMLNAELIASCGSTQASMRTLPCSLPPLSAAQYR